MKADSLESEQLKMKNVEKGEQTFSAAHNTLVKYIAM